MKNLFFSALITAMVLTIPASPLHAQTTTDCKGKPEALECLGGLSGLMLYNTYAYIGAVGDASAKGVYSDADVIDLMDEQIGTLAVVDSQLIALNTSGFITDPDDKAYISDISKTIGFLKEEARYLKRYKATASQSDLDEYNYNREQAWALIVKLLGIEED